MGDIIKNFPVQSIAEIEVKLRVYFDSGSPFTFIKKQASMELQSPVLQLKREFGGMGDGKFHASGLMEIVVKLLDIWCPQTAYVVEDETLDEGYEILAGHDFTQRYDIKLDSQKRDIIVDKAALIRAQKIRNCGK